MRMASLVFPAVVLLAGGLAAAQQSGREGTPTQIETLPAGELTFGDDGATGADRAEQLTEITPPPIPSLSTPHAAAAVIRNLDVIQMHAAGFGASTIIAAIEANATAFDVAPRDLLALKRAGVAEPVIESMLATKRAPAAADDAHADVRAGDPVPPSATAPDGTSAEALAQLSRMIEQLAAAPPAAAAPTGSAAERAAVAAEPQPDNPHAPRAWVADGDAKVPIAPTVAKVAYTDMKRPAATAFKTLQNFGAKALAFANPAIGAATSGLGDLFRNHDDAATTAVWALLGSSSTRELRAGTAFEIDFANVPGVDPSRYRPAIVQLVPTTDNFRLVGAAKTGGGDAAAAPRGSIIEEPVAADLVRLDRGRYRVALGGDVPPGEYALVLRPIQQHMRERRRNADSSLGELMGANATSQIIYLTWDFSVEG
jgi:hypothetical protein